MDVVWVVLTAPITLALAPPSLAAVAWLAWHERRHPDCEEH